MKNLLSPCVATDATYATAFPPLYHYLYLTHGTLRKILTLPLPLGLCLCASFTTATQAHPTITLANGAKTTTIACGSTVSIQATYEQPYLVTVTGGLTLINPATAQAGTLQLLQVPTFQVAASYGGGTIYVRDPSDEVIQDSVVITVTSLNALVGNIIPMSGNACLASAGSAQYFIPVSAGGGDVTYAWTVVSGDAYTTLDAATQASQTATVNSLTAGTSVLQVAVTNGCVTDVCNAPVRTYTIRKTLSAEDQAALAIAGPTCVADDIATGDNLITLSVPAVLGHDDAAQYAWQYPAPLVARTRSQDGTYLALTLTEALTAPIDVLLNLGNTCNPGLTYRHTLTPVAPYPTVPPTLSGPACIPYGDASPVTFTANDTDMTYLWQVQQKDAAGTLSPAPWVAADSSNISGATLQVIPNFSGVADGDQFVVTAETTGACRTGTPVTGTTVVNIGPATPAYITVSHNGNTTTLAEDAAQCFTPGESYLLTVANAPFADTYAWSASIPANGWIFNSSTDGHQLTATAGTSSITLTVNAQSPTCSTPPPLQVHALVNDQQPGTITLQSGSECIVPDRNSLVYLAVPDIAGAYFTWHVPNNNDYVIQSGQGTHAVAIVVVARPGNTALNAEITVSTTSAAGCENTSAPYTLTYGDAPDLSLVFRNGNNCQSRFIQAPNASDYEYAWYLNDVLSASTSFYVDFGCSVTYPLQLVVTNTTNGCVSEKTFAGDTGCTGCE